MGLPSPYELAQQIGTRFGNVMQKQEQKSTIEDILQRATQSGNPADLQNLYGEILTKVAPENQQNVLGILQKKVNEIKESEKIKKEKEVLIKEGLSPEFAGLSDSFRNTLLKEGNVNKKKLATDLLEEKKKDSVVKYLVSKGKHKEEDIKDLPFKVLSDIATRDTSSEGQKEVITFRENQKFLDEVYNKKDIANRFLTRTAVNQARAANDNERIGVFEATMGQQFPKLKGSKQAVLDASMVQLFEPFTKIFPGMISREKFNFIASRIAQAGQSPEAINAFLDFVEKLSGAADVLPDAISSLVSEDPNVMTNPSMRILATQKATDLFNEVQQEFNSLFDKLESNDFSGEENSPPEPLKNKLTEEQRAEIIRRLQS